MTCEERKDLIPFYAVGTLEPAEYDAMRMHLEGGCPVCTTELSSVQAVATELAMSLDPVSPSKQVRERLLKRIADQSLPLGIAKERSASKPTPLPMQISRARPTAADWFRSLITATVAAALAYVAATVSFREHQNVLQTRLVQLESQLTEMQSTRKSTEQMITLPRSPAMQVVLLKGTPDAPDAKADLFYDRARGVWYLYTTGLKPPGEKRAYELWFIAGDTKTRAGVFDVTPEGEGSLIAAVPPDLGKITLAAVTDEPAGGSLQPTGKIRLVGAMP